MTNKEVTSISTEVLDTVSGGRVGPFVRGGLYGGALPLWMMQTAALNNAALNNPNKQLTDALTAMAMIKMMTA